jgi:YidC/Oxa1 family membrane protein insertase
MSSRFELSTITLLSLVFVLGTSASSAEPMTRDAALAASQRIAIDSPTLRGSIALKGGRIDDITLALYHETVDPLSPTIVLLSPLGSPQPYYAEFGWVVAAGSTVKVPGPDTEWRQGGSGRLRVGEPVTLFYDNTAGLIFRRTISVDDKYVFSINDEVKNAGTTPVTLYPYALISRHGTPQVHGLYMLHEGLIGVMGDQGLQEYTYKRIEDKKSVTWDVTNAWLGITDEYWAATLLPDTDAKVNARFSAGEAGGLKFYQTDYSLQPQTIAPGATGSANARLFAGAKEVSVVGINFPFGPGGYNQALHLNHFDLLIDWGFFNFIAKPVFLALDFFVRLVGNYGIAILLFAVLVQLLFFPLANKSYATAAKRKLGMNERVHPILRGMYIAILVMVQGALLKLLWVTVEMRQAPFFGWINDLSVPDPTNVFNVFGLMPFDPTALPVFGSFLNLGIWPAIMCLTMWVVIKLNRAPVDPTQKVIFNCMPIIVGYSVASFAVALVIYRVVHSSLSLLHQSLMLHRYGAKIQPLDGLKRTFAKLTLKRALSDSLTVLQARGSHAPINISIKIRSLRWIRRASRITFWLSAILLLISRSSDNAWLGVFAVTAVLAVVVYLIALWLGQRLAGREFAAALASDPEGNRAIILFLRSFGIARSSLSARFIVELGYIVRSSFSIGMSSLAGDAVGLVDRRYEVEENLDNAIGLSAMFVAIGDRLASYGAVKITVKEEDWQKTFSRLASVSQLIFMMPGPSASALWELSQIMQSRHLLEKTVFIMPRGARRSLIRSWNNVREMAGKLGVNLPIYVSEGCYFRLLENGRAGETFALEPFTRALRKFLRSPSYTGVIDLAKVAMFYDQTDHPPPGEQRDNQWSASQSMGFWEAVASGFTNYVTFSGRAIRSEFWYWILFTVLGASATGVIDAVVFPQTAWPPTLSIFHLVTFLPSVAVGVRRLHDIDRSGWWMVTALTIIGVFVLIYWFCKPSTPTDNQFGPDPLEEINPRSPACVYDITTTNPG